MGDDTASGTPPFAEMRVLDLSRGIAGAHAARVLADLGASVCVVEPPGGSPLRRRDVAGVLAEGEDAPLWRHLRAGAGSIVVDTAADDAEALLAELVADADVLIDDAPPGSGLRGLLDEVVRSAGRDDLVAVSVTPWGTSGPWAARPATGFTVELDCGSVDRRGLPPRPPIPVGGDLVDWLGGTFALAGVAAAWWRRVRTGQGARLDVSLLEAAVLCLNGPYRTLSAQWFPTLVLPRAIEVPSIEPAADGSVGFCTQTAQQWFDFCALIGRPDLAEEPGFTSADERMRAIETIRAAIADFCSERTVDEIVDVAAAMRIPVTPVGTGATLPTFDHLVARQVHVRGDEGVLAPRPPFRFSTSVTAPRGRSPRPGEKTVSPDAAPVAPSDTSPSGVTSPADQPPGSGSAEPFAGLRVVDLTAFWAGPILTQFLGVLGADVVKVESIQRPDGIRFLGSFDLDSSWERSFVFHGVNTDKRGVTLDLGRDEGRELLARLLDDADVLVENFTPRVLENFGISWDDLRRDHPQLILARMPAFGLDGPWRDRAGFAMTIEQTSGMAWTTGYADLPVVPRGPCDPAGGMHAVVALTAALVERERTGAGQLVEVPMLEVACGLAAEAVLEHDVHGVVLDRETPPATCPRALLRAAGDDEWLGIEVVDDDQWRALVEVVPALADPDLALLDGAGRRARRATIDEVLALWARGQRASDAADVLVAAGVPAAALRRSGDIVEHPQLASRAAFVELDHPVTGRVGYPGFPIHLGTRDDGDVGPVGPTRRPPLLGEHTREVLTELGVDDETYRRLESERIVGTRPAWL